MFSPNTEWNLDITKGQGSGKICSAMLKTSLYRVPFHIFYYIAISWFKKKNVRYTKDLVIERFVKSRFKCMLRLVFSSNGVGVGVVSGVGRELMT